MLCLFLRIERTKAKFIGVYKVKNEEPKKRVNTLPENYPYPRQLVEDEWLFLQTGEGFRF